jgi:hypothetical protein
MWSIYEEEAEVTDTQKEGADDGLLAFVSYNLLIVYSLGLTSSKDWSVLRSCRPVHCRKLQEVISRLRRYDDDSSHPDITATRWSPE